MKTYKQLNYEERVTIKIGLYKKMSIREIARLLGRFPSTISREIKRGITVDGTYFADSTERQLRKRKMDKYDDWFKLLTRKKKYNYRKNKGKKKMTINNKVNISERPEIANQRVEFGHFEADTIFSCRGSKSALLVLVDRFTRKTHIKKLERKTAFLTSSSIVVALSEYNNLHIHSITYDNGCEFAGHEDVNNVLQCKSYFCNAYHSWEKGMVENINGLIRRFLPKGTNFDNITDKQIKKIENWIK